MTSTFNDYYYEDFAHPDDQILNDFSDDLRVIVYYLIPFKLTICIIAFILNVLHLIIVTRKPFRNNSIYVIMAAITMCDLLVMMTILNGLYVDRIAFFREPDCWIPFSYCGIIIQFAMSYIQSGLRRLSTWLALLMALVRLLIVKNPLNPSLSCLSTRPFAIILILILFLASSIIDFFTAIQYEFVNDGPYRIRYCYYLPRNYSVPYSWTSRQSQWTDDFRPLAIKYSLMSNAVSKIIPAATLPILSFLLIRIMRKAAKSREKLTKGCKDAEFEKSIRMVALMTVFSMFAEGVTGIVSAIVTFYYDYYHIYASMDLLDAILINLAVLNAIVHSVICYTVNSQYKEEAGKTILWWRKKANKVGTIENQRYPSPTIDRITASNAIID